jgi:cob(I)alamin adenosyltransferase
MKVPRPAFCLQVLHEPPGTFYSPCVSVTINRVYTKIGDGGTTRLAGGQEIAKDSLRLEAYGSVDELNAVIGVLIESCDWAAMASARIRLLRIQNELFDLGGELATLTEDRHPKQILVSSEDITRLENEIDEWNGGLPTLKSFILPGGGLMSALAHQARTVCRRAERRTVRLNAEDKQRPEVIQYLNRLSDWFFVFGRVASLSVGAGELLWKPGERG